MAKFILVDEKLLNSNSVVEILFLDDEFTIVFKMANNGGNHHKTYENEEYYEVACSNLKSHLEAIYID